MVVGSLPVLSLTPPFGIFALLVCNTDILKVTDAHGDNPPALVLSNVI
tara:strand:+ start:20 stop:163 length:144 start_codon:yes stop_codon:yes gene_type:complete